jgi:hypothetical protein
MKHSPDPTPRYRSAHRERGAVLVIVMLVMMVLMGMGVTALWLASGNLNVAGSMNMRQQALYVAEAGLNRAIARLNDPAALNLDQLLAGTGHPLDDVPRSSNVGADGIPLGIGAVLIDTGTPLAGVAFPPASFNRGAGTEAAPVPTSMGSYTVWIRNDQGELRRGPAFYTADGGNQSVVLRAQGVAIDGRTTVVLEQVLIPGTAGNNAPPIAGQIPPSLCFSGKNACDDNSGTVAGMEVVN